MPSDRSQVPLEAEPLEAEPLATSAPGRPMTTERDFKDTLREWSVPLAIAVILLLSFMSVVIYEYLQEEDIPVHGIRSPEIIEHTMDIHVVTVGFEQGVFDESYIEGRVAKEYRPYDTRLSDPGVRVPAVQLQLPLRCRLRRFRQ